VRLVRNKLQRTTSPLGPAPNLTESGFPVCTAALARVPTLMALLAHIFPNHYQASWGWKKAKFDHLDKTKDLAGA
jgi:hypothetical protein